MKKKLLVYLIILLAYPERIFPDEVEDIIKLGKTYSQDVSLEFSIVLNYNNGKTESYSGTYSRNSGGLFYRVFHIESFCDNKYSMVIDNSQKLIVIGNSLDKEKIDKELLGFISKLQLSPETIKNNYALSYISSGSNKAISMKAKDDDNEFEFIEVVFDNEYNLVSINYKFKKNSAKNHITDYSVTYSKQRLGNSVLLPGKLNDYVSIRNNKIEPSKKYFNYKVIDNRLKSK